MNPPGRSVVRLLGDGVLHPGEREAVTWLWWRWQEQGLARTPGAPFYVRRATASAYDLWLWQEHEVPVDLAWLAPRRDPATHLMRRCVEEFIRMGLARRRDIAHPEQAFRTVVAHHQGLRAREAEERMRQPAPAADLRRYRGTARFGDGTHAWPATVLQACRRQQHLTLEIQGGTREGHFYRSQCSLSIAGTSASGRGETQFPGGGMLKVERIALAVLHDADGCLELEGTWADEGDETAWEFALDLEQIGS